MTPAPADGAPHPELRHLVRGMLADAGAFGRLGTDDQQKLARSLVQVLSYLTDPYAGLSPRAAAAPDAPEARALEDANSTLKSRLAAKQNLVGKDFKAGAATEGAKAFRSLVSAVDFPAFVSGLIEGVYGSLVRSSIQQMQEYMKLLSAVVKSVEEYAQENVSPDSARSFVAASFPDSVELSEGKLKLRDDGDGPAPDFKTVLEMQENVALEEETEERVVLAAQLKMARQRQQQLAMMVAMGINRIIVTDGEIKASVLFDVKSRDTAARDNQAATWDQTTDRKESGGGWFDSDSEVQTKVSSAYSAEQDKSTADLETKAKLSGSVLVKFKSETFPLERLASSAELGAVQQKGAR